MVLLSRCLSFCKNQAAVMLRKRNQTTFTDSLRIYVKAGSGGHGIEKFGGLGGRGGNVIAIAADSLTLTDLKKRHGGGKFVAQNGKSSTHMYIAGADATDVELSVPTGVAAYTDDGRKIGELNLANERLVLARGGPGGNPKTRYKGQRGEAGNVTLELKLIADVGLVGFPNAGKSTLLAAISRAKPKIGNYPFTTIRPNIGIMEYADSHKISMADLPGLIEGAHVNRGMGHRFLRHVERTGLLVLVVDIDGFRLSDRYVYRSCVDTLVLLNMELDLYNPELLDKPAICLINKMDKPDAQRKFDEVHERIMDLSGEFVNYSEHLRPSKALVFEDILPISAASGDVELVKQSIRRILDRNDSRSNHDREELV